MSPDEAPPLGQRPTEPTPGKESLQDPRGRHAEQAGHQDGARGPDDQGACPDCGLPFGQHPEFHSHASPSGGLPGQELDAAELGGDPAEG